jgi:hypothetical protein
VSVDRERMRAVVDSALAYARFQAHGSFERFAKFYGENLGAELGDRARRTREEERGVSDTERLIEKARKDARENMEFFPVGGEHEPYHIMGRQMERSANLMLALCDALLAFQERERGLQEPIEAALIDLQTVHEGMSDPVHDRAAFLAGVKEVAGMLAVSKQRVSDLAAEGRLPAPIARLASGPVWRQASIERFAERWDRRPGRRRVEREGG